MEKWQDLSIEQISEKLNTSVTDGLSRKQARDRRDKHADEGKKNFAPLYMPRKKNLFSCLLSPLFCLTYAVYFVIAVFAFLSESFYFGAWTLGLLTFQIISLGVMTAYAVRIKEKNNLYSIPTVCVLRSGEVKYTSSENIAEGDILMFSKGDVIPCDIRLVEDDGLVVDEFYFGEDGRLLRRRISKDSQESGREKPIDSPNMVMAGSVVISGSGRGIAVTVFEDAYLAQRFTYGEMSGDIKKPVGILKLLESTKTVSVIASAIILIITLIGMMVLRSFSFSFIFLMALSSMICVSPSVVDIVARIIFSGSIRHMPEGTVVKNNKAIDVLTSFSDMLLLGRTGICDGKLHISSLFLSGRKLDSQMLESKPDRTHRLCEYLYTYLKIASDKKNIETDSCREGLANFMSEMHFDTQANDLKIKSLYYLEDDMGMGYACAESHGHNFRIALGYEAYMIANCRFLRVGDMPEPLDNTLKHRILDYVEECENSGERLIFVISEDVKEGAQKGENIVLEGILAFEEHIIDGISETLEKYREMGIRITSLMLDESPESIKYLVSSGMISSVSDTRIAFASDFKKNGRDVKCDFGKYTVYAGFDMDEYYDLVNHMKSQGSVIISYGVEDDFTGIMTMSDTSVVCNSTPYGTENYRESLYDKLPDAGMDTSENATQRGRLAAGLAVPRKEGLKCILDASDASCSAYINLSYYLRYAVLLISTVLPLVILSAASGLLMINSLQILFVFSFVLLVGLYAFSQNVPRSEFFRNNKRSYVALPKPLVLSAIPLMCSRALAVVLYFVAALVLAVVGAVSREGVAFSSFIGVFVICIYEMFSTDNEYAQYNRKGKKIIRMTLYFSFAVVLVVCAVMGLWAIDYFTEGELRDILRIPSAVFSEFYGGKTHVISLILVPIFLVLNVICELIYGKVSHRVNAKLNSIK